MKSKTLISIIACIMICFVSVGYAATSGAISVFGTAEASLP